MAALAKAGFAVVRIRGSHHSLKHEDGRGTVVPAHSRRSSRSRFVAQDSSRLSTERRRLAEASLNRWPGRPTKAASLPHYFKNLPIDRVACRIRCSFSTSAKRT
ncbi:MAG: type II toxin-antitoxin system HicA family toxin [Bryobacteraceae bacterium]